MSKASEYAQRLKEAQMLNRPELRATANLSITYRAPMHRDVAMDLAHWILATFGEADGEDESK